MYSASPNVDAKILQSALEMQNGVGPGRPDRIIQVMSCHPQYLEVFLKTQAFIMKGDGPLPYDYRHYIAIMAAGRHRCSYLVEEQESEFLLIGGDERWLEGLSNIPKKLHDLYEVNKMLAHRPWLITKAHIERLTKGSDSWSLGELVHALVILTHYHALSSFVFGCGIGDGHQEPPTSNSPPPQAHTPTDGAQTPPVDVPASPPASPAHPATAVGRRGSASSCASTASSSPRDSRRNSPHGDEVVGVDVLMKRMKTLSERQEHFSAEEQTKRYENVECSTADLGLQTVTSNRIDPEISQFIEDEEFTYTDFSRRGETPKFQTFRVQDYSWDDHGFSLVNRLYNDVGYLLDDKFRLTYSLTYYTMGSRRDVDTSRFRRAIWNYIQCIYGIRHDDYDYGEVNQLLERSLKSYIKSVVCFPERVTRKDYNSVLKEFRHSEKIHVNLMMLEARMQAELLYALRAVMRHMT